MLRHINCIRGEENYVSGGVIAEEEALDGAQVHTRAHALWPWPISSRAQLEGGASPTLCRLRRKEPISILRVSWMWGRNLLVHTHTPGLCHWN